MNRSDQWCIGVDESRCGRLPHGLAPADGPVPPVGTPERAWWQRGAADEARARDEGLSGKVKEFVKYAEALAENRPGATAAELAETTAYVFAGPFTLRRVLRMWWRWRRV
ncbi:MAG: hypothetical protein EPO06_11735 [Burkholderiaceae bacterium]|nr:MAG: hypothetical protein EPO06_11735 [Burkholderiaceae bacterium]